MRSYVKNHTNTIITSPKKEKSPLAGVGGGRRTGLFSQRGLDVFNIFINISKLF